MAVLGSGLRRLCRTRPWVNRPKANLTKMRLLQSTGHIGPKACVNLCRSRSCFRRTNFRAPALVIPLAGALQTPQLAAHPSALVLRLQEIRALAFITKEKTMLQAILTAIVAVIFTATTLI